LYTTSRTCSHSLLCTQNERPLPLLTPCLASRLKYILNHPLKPFHETPLEYPATTCKQGEAVGSHAATDDCQDCLELPGLPGLLVLAMSRNQKARNEDPGTWIQEQRTRNETPIKQNVQKRGPRNEGQHALNSHLPLVSSKTHLITLSS
jgi:hypothetical protein